MMSDLRKDLLLIVSGILSGLILYLLGVACYRAGQRNPLRGDSGDVKVVTDTLVVRDTIRVEKPVFRTKYVDRVQLVPVTDTIRRTDTLFMAVDIERRTYAGDDYRAVVSGWHPSLDEIEVYPKTVYLQTQVTQTPAPSRRRTRAGVGVAAGPGVFWTPQGGTQFGAGAVVGLSITF